MDRESLPLLLTVVKSQPGPVVEEGQWSTGLCECCGDMDDCCFALWCLPVFACKTSRAAGGCVCLPLLDCVGCVPPASLAMRAAVRERYGIKGNVFSDCFYGCCCYPLSWCQISREIKKRTAALSKKSSSPFSSKSKTCCKVRSVSESVCVCLFSCPPELYKDIMAKMVVQQPQPVVVVASSNQWSSGVCDCCDNVPECCFGFWCLPCFACSTAKKHGECLCLPLLELGFIPPITLAMRTSVRQRYGIEGTICNDCVYSFFCCPCVWCQMSREMKQRSQPVTFINRRAK